MLFGNGVHPRLDSLNTLPMNSDSVIVVLWVKKCGTLRVQNHRKDATTESWYTYKTEKWDRESQKVGVGSTMFMMFCDMSTSTRDYFSNRHWPSYNSPS